MHWLERIILVAVYPVLVGSRLLSAALREDPLRLRERKGTCWVERSAQPPPASYFHDGPHSGRLPLPQRLLIACSLALRRRQRSPSRRAGGEIPDEIYTLW
jgi:hypothetical protein